MVGRKPTFMRSLSSGRQLKRKPTTLFWQFIDEDRARSLTKACKRKKRQSSDGSESLADSESVCSDSSLGRRSTSSFRHKKEANYCHICQLMKMLLVAEGKRCSTADRKKTRRHAHGRSHKPSPKRRRSYHAVSSSDATSDASSVRERHPRRYRTARSTMGLKRRRRERTGRVSKRQRHLRERKTHRQNPHRLCPMCGEKFARKYTEKFPPEKKVPPEKRPLVLEQKEEKTVKEKAKSREPSPARQHREQQGEASQNKETAVPEKKSESCDWRTRREERRNSSFWPSSDDQKNETKKEHTSDVTVMVSNRPLYETPSPEKHTRPEQDEEAQRVSAKRRFDSRGHYRSQSVSQPREEDSSGGGKSWRSDSSSRPSSRRRHRSRPAASRSSSSHVRCSSVVPSKPIANLFRKKY